MSERIIVCGGNTYRNWRKMRLVLATLPHDAVIVHGGAKGADRLAAQVWRGLRPDGVIEEWPAGLAERGHKRRMAKRLRNKQMLDAGADRVIAFPGGDDTADLLRRAGFAGVPIWEVGDWGPDDAA